MFSLKLSNGIPAVRNIRHRYTGRRIPPLWVSYESPVSNPPHENLEVQHALKHFGANHITRGM